MSNDKFPALPTRPNVNRLHCPCDECIGLWIVYMDAQDARIADLESEVEFKYGIMLRAFQRADKAEAKVAELEREIREARELLENAVSPYMTWDHKHRDWNNARRNWRERNVERENGQ